MIQREEERFMGSSCEMPAKPPRCADVGHNPPPPIMFLSGASIELTGQEREAHAPDGAKNGAGRAPGAPISHAASNALGCANAREVPGAWRATQVGPLNSDPQSDPQEHRLVRVGRTGERNA